MPIATMSTSEATKYLNNYFMHVTYYPGINIYHHATETQFSIFENTNFLFPVSVSLTQFF